MGDTFGAVISLLMMLAVIVPLVLLPFALLRWLWRAGSRRR